MKRTLSILLVCLLFSACSYHIEKRRYFSGFYISTPGKTTPTTLAKTAEPEFAKLKPRSPGYVSVIAPAPGNLLSVRKSENPPPRRTPVKRASQPVSDEIPVVASPLIPVDAKPSPTGSGAVPADPLRDDAKQDRSFLLFSGLLVALVPVFFIPFIPRTRKLGYLAVNNRTYAKGILFALHSLMAACGLAIGKWLFETGITTTEVTTWTLAAAASGITLLYPIRKVKTGFFRNTYFKQKLFSLLLNLTGLLLFVNAGNRFASGDFGPDPVTTLIQAESQYAHDIPAPPTAERDASEDKAVKILLTVLTAVFGLLLSVLVVGGSCALACNGQEGLAIVTLFVGLPLIILAAVTIIKSIWKPRPEKKPSVQPEPSQG